MPSGAASLGAWWDESAAQKACDFFPRYLRHTEAEWAGHPFRLADWQRDNIVRPLFGWKRADGTRLIRIVWLEVPKKNGKALALDTPIPTPSGWTTMGAIAVGDAVLDELGRATKVVATSEVFTDHACYEVAFSNGERIVADANHRWLTTTLVDRPGSAAEYPRRPAQMTRVRTTTEIRDTLLASSRGARNHSILMPEPLELPERDLPVDPYVLGYWLGDGYSESAAIACGDEDVDELCEQLRGAGIMPSKSRERTAWRVQIRATRGTLLGGEARNKSDPENLQILLRAIGVLGNKHIPPAYLRGSLSQRIALLQGLMDSDGYADPRGTILEFSSVNKAIADGISELLATLGIKHGTREVPMRCNGQPVPGSAFRVQFCVSKDRVPVFRLARKLARQKAGGDVTRSRTVQIVNVRSVDPVPVKCIAVDSASHLYLAGRTMLPTHNTELAAGLACLLLLGDGEQGGQGYALAVDKEQARLVFSKAGSMISMSPQLRHRIEVYKNAIFVPELMASFKPLASNPDSKDGFSPTFAIGDEVHRWPSGAMAEVVHNGTAARRQPVEIYITTAGIRGDGYAWEMHELAEAHLRGEVIDPTFLPVIFAASPDADWRDETTWRAANPNYNVSVKATYMAEAAQKAARSPRAENDFKRFHLNIWTEQAERWLPMVGDEDGNQGWRECTAEPENPQLWRTLAERVQGRTAYGALDLSLTRDLCSLCWAFPPERDGDRWIFLWRFWLPEAAVRNEPIARRTRYESWAASGAITLTPGNVTDHAFIRRQINADAQVFRPAWIGIDPFNAGQMKVELFNEDGLPIEDFRQGFLSMSPAAKSFERLVSSAAIEHGSHPIAWQHARNAVVDRDAAGNIKPTKARAADKIDGIVAAVMACGGAVTAAPPVQEPSIFVIV